MTDTALDMIREYLQRNGYDGLATRYGCGCGVNDLAPCVEGLGYNCHAAKARVLGPDSLIGEYRDYLEGETVWEIPQ